MPVWAGAGEESSARRLRLCKTITSGPGHAASTGARVFLAWAALYAVSGSALAQTALETTPGTLDSGTGERNIPGAPRGSRRLGGGGSGQLLGRMSGSAPARGAPRDSIVAPEPDFARP